MRTFRRVETKKAKLVMASMKRKKRKKVRPKELLRKRSNWKTRPKTQRLSAEMATMPASQALRGKTRGRRPRAQGRAQSRNPPRSFASDAGRDG